MALLDLTPEEKSREAFVKKAFDGIINKVDYATNIKHEKLKEKVVDGYKMYQRHSFLIKDDKDGVKFYNYALHTPNLKEVKK